MIISYNRGLSFFDRLDSRGRMRHFLIWIVVYLRLLNGAEQFLDFDNIFNNVEAFGADETDSMGDFFDVFFHNEDDDEDDQISALSVDDVLVPIALPTIPAIPTIPALPALPAISDICSITDSETTASSSPSFPLISAPERQRSLRERIKSIFKAKYPTSKYNLRKFDIINWPEGLSLFKNHWTVREMRRIEERLPVIYFVLRDKVISYDTTVGLDKFECLTKAEITPDFSQAEFMKLITERFKLEVGCPDSEITRIDWDLLDRSALPAKYKNVPINSFSYFSKLIFANKEIVDNIHFHKPLQIGPKLSRKRPISEASSNEPEPERKAVSSAAAKREIDRVSLNNDLKKLFEEQFPGKKYNLRKFDVLNWPEGVDLLSQYHSVRDVQRIRERFHLFRFVERPVIMTKHQQFGLDALGDLHGVLNYEWKRNDILPNCLKVFQKETGDHDAKFVKWAYLDRKDIPAKYDGILINSYTMSMPKFYKNSEIVNNIHFFKPEQCPDDCSKQAS